jgi:NADPH:quinone reductase-like Zn-dependent oxidoreductase
MRAAVIRRSGATPALGQFADPQPGQGLSVGTLAAAALNPLDIAIVNDQFPFHRLQPPASLATRRSCSSATARAAT